MPHLLAIALAATLATGLLAAAAAHAQEAGDAPIPLAEWREMTAGKTLVYEIDGDFWGREYYHPDRDVATFVTRDGDCVTAPWVYAEGLYCFSYRGMECFRHLRRGDRILVAPLSGGAEQEVRRIEVAPLSCEPPLSS